MAILDGKLVSTSIKDNIKIEVEQIKEKYNKDIQLAVVLVGDDPASKIYVRNKEKACKKVGIISLTIELDKNSTQDDVIGVVDELALDDNINGILVQLPLPSHIDKTAVISHIPPIKDVDGLTDENVSSLVQNKDGIVSCTPQGVYDLMNYYGINVEGKNVVIIGRSILVGKPLALLLLNKNATVTMCHSKTNNLQDITKNADIIVSAVGKPNLITKDMVNENSIIIDVGINRIEDKVVGDTDFENLKDYVAFITPVPGGCGPMTIAELLNNTLKCFKKQNNL